MSKTKQREISAKSQGLCDARERLPVRYSLAFRFYDAYMAGRREHQCGPGKAPAKSAFFKASEKSFLSKFVDKFRIFKKS